MSEALQLNYIISLCQIKFILNLDLFLLQFSITGLFGDEDYSKEISQKISEAVPEIINNNPEIFLDIVGPLIVELMNALINDEIGVGIIKQMVKTCIIDVLFPPY